MPALREAVRSACFGGTLTGAALAFLIAAPAAHAGENHQVVIERFVFSPATLTITRGDTVEFVNTDPAPHTATEDDTLWDTGELKKGQSARIEFPDAGTSTYYCVFHPNMKAEIVVIEN
ncbi:cupredoxin domain-containing protein [Roseibium salinum]|uniref:Cupredoxin family copper-binding protein n=1 Tax=Roseibium salinum TaxID=1604349 RepID=A0ABT3R4A6_9HYPH|nr:cupredoxin family copper-binding protein [Roseibium sp. DSM 29163]MCX2723976.1 cupredoxin family copper-binding protein [Roseibium sp. DSM 29163]